MEAGSRSLASTGSNEASPVRVRAWEPPLLFAAVASLLTPNPFLTAVAFLSLGLILRLTLRPDEPPIMALVMSLQWLQGALQVLYADAMGEPIWRTSLAHSIEEAVGLTLVWAVVVSFGVWLALSRQPPVALVSVGELPSHAVRRTFWVYIACYASSTGLALIPYRGLSQIAGATLALRMSVVFALLLLAVRKAPGARLVWGVFAYELLTGFLGFFSDFKTPLLLLFCVYLSDLRRFRLQHAVGATVVAAAAIALAVVWTAVKTDYRDAMNQGTGDQAVRIDRSERANTLIDLVTNTSESELGQAVHKLVARTAYVEYFAFVLDYVPRMRDHEGGRLWLGAFEHVLYPRFFFPDKANLELDTRITERYTGLQLVSEMRQTSISIGTPGESYVDFGRVLMFVPALLAGLLYGWTYRVLIRLSPYSTLPFGLAAAVLLGQMTIGLTPAKLLGGHLMSLGCALLFWYAFGARMSRWAFGVDEETT